MSGQVGSSSSGSRASRPGPLCPVLLHRGVFRLVALRPCWDTTLKRTWGPSLCAPGGCVIGAAGPSGDPLRVHRGGRGSRSSRKASREGPSPPSPAVLPPPLWRCGAQNTLSCLCRQGRLGPSSPSPWPLDMERADSVRAENRGSLRASRPQACSRP